MVVFLGNKKIKTHHTPLCTSHFGKKQNKKQNPNSAKERKKETGKSVKKIKNGLDRVCVCASADTIHTICLVPYPSARTISSTPLRPYPRGGTNLPMHFLGSVPVN